MNYKCDWTLCCDVLFFFFDILRSNKCVGLLQVDVMQFVYCYYRLNIRKGEKKYILMTISYEHEIFMFSFTLIFSSFREKKIHFTEEKSLLFHLYTLCVVFMFDVLCTVLMLQKEHTFELHISRKCRLIGVIVNYIWC